MRILLSTNGTEWADRALETGTQVALAAGSSVDILAAAPSPDRLKKASKVAVKAADHLEAASISVAVIERLARLGQEVISQAATSPYDQVV
jgi:nucleotide-binding universal stress UspA family protein